MEENNNKKSKVKGLIWIATIFVVAFYFSNVVSLLVRLIPWSVEMKLAEKLDSAYHPHLCANGNVDAQKALNKFVARLYPLESLDNEKEFKLNIQIIHNDQVNAFATIGGEIFILSGLLRDVDTPEELAGVVAHEIAHLKERHVLQGLLVKILLGSGEIGDNFFNIGFTKNEEHEADQLGLERLKAAKISAKGYYDFFTKRGSEPQWLALISDHPGNEFRKGLAQKYLGLPSEKILDADEWKLLKNFCD